MSYDCYCDYDPPSVLGVTRPRARKPHRCCECGASVAIGEQYEYVFGVWYGEAQTYKTCAQCVDIRTWTQNNVPCLCWNYGDLISSCKEAVVEAQHRAPDETKGLYFALLRRLVARKKFNEVRA